MEEEFEEEYDSLEALRDAVQENGGVMTVPAWVVRDAYGADRLGSNVRANITTALRGLGVGQMPLEFPDRQWTPVRLYKIGSPSGDLIEAVQEPGKHGDQTIRESVGGDTQRTLEKIRELVCE